ncbi:MAG: nitroreductase, partial [Chloroflexota bacterium]
EQKAKEVLGIPDDMTLITLVIVGKHSETSSPILSEKQAEWEKARPERLPLNDFVHVNHFQAE